MLDRKFKRPPGQTRNLDLSSKAEPARTPLHSLIADGKSLQQRSVIFSEVNELDGTAG